MLAVSGVLLVLVLAFAVIRPRGLPEAVAAVPAAVVVIAVGAVLVVWPQAAPPASTIPPLPKDDPRR